MAPWSRGQWPSDRREEKCEISVRELRRLDRRSWLASALASPRAIAANDAHSSLVHSHPSTSSASPYPLTSRAHSAFSLLLPGSSSLHQFATVGEWLCSPLPPPLPPVPPAPVVDGGGDLPLFPPLMVAIPSLLESLSPHILRSHMTTAHFKPIPNNERVDLAGFRVKEPQEWSADDVVAWMLDVARSHNIPFEDFNMHRFANFDGKSMMRLSETSFLELDANYGGLLFREFRKASSVTPEDTVIDDAMRKYRESVDEEQQRTQVQEYKPNPLPEYKHHPLPQALPQALPQGPLLGSGMLGPLPPLLMPPPRSIPSTGLPQPLAFTAAPGFLHGHQFDLSGKGLSLPPPLQTQQSHQQSQSSIVDTTRLQLAQSLAAANSLTTLQNLSTNLSLQQIQAALSPRSPMNTQGLSPGTIDLLSKYTHQQPGTSNQHDEDYSSDDDDMKVTRNKDGRPRKRSQHTKGNKLWEFIRDALKDPLTCPSIVKWEDPIEGVFRIVESEKLARLWGERKNNHKMTYEKLSRAMRTYYEKQILVPVPKTGLYPKKLVYKFGPCSHGWQGLKQHI
ncbi:unnamed protein product, partial [Mesorhabditis belari]|uniref:ETS domain-containing protein n=1 Tax=Mesorhabditis belari TaxID=2138241 RepID=A0AAF3FI89_9BILA